MVQTMRMRKLQGKVMDVCMWIELQEQVLRGMSVRRVLVLHFAGLLAFWTKTGKTWGY
jgi:hypothetical protein